MSVIHSGLYVFGMAFPRDCHVVMRWSVDTLRREISNQTEIKRNWGLGVTALFFHGVADPIVTYFSIVILDVGFESNQWLAGYLHEGFFIFFTAHIPLYLLVAGSLCALTWLFTRATPAETEQLYHLSLLAWIGIILWGAVVVGHNLLVLVATIIQ